MYIFVTLLLDDALRLVLTSVVTMETGLLQKVTSKF